MPTTNYAYSFQNCFRFTKGCVHIEVEALSEPWSIPRTVLLTGANRGLGLEMVKQMVDGPSPLPRLFACCKYPYPIKKYNFSNCKNRITPVDPATIGSQQAVSDLHFTLFGLNHLWERWGECRTFSFFITVVQIFLGFSFLIKRYIAIFPNLQINRILFKSRPSHGPLLRHPLSPLYRVADSSGIFDSPESL